VVTSDFLAAGGDGYTGLQQMQDKVMTGRLISDMVIEAFRTDGTVAPQLDGRILRLAADSNPAPAETQP
jgi:2',3'-cyclic-nucleotide 2'-phosphodiesterase (5'-nucleotidase family)